MSLLTEVSHLLGTYQNQLLFLAQNIDANTSSALLLELALVLARLDLVLGQALAMHPDLLWVLVLARLLVLELAILWVLVSAKTPKRSTRLHIHLR